MADRHRVGANHDVYAEIATRQLSESAEPLLEACLAGLDEAKQWLARTQSGLIGALFRKHPKRCEEYGRVQKRKEELAQALKEFREEKRYTPYQLASSPHLICFAPIRLTILGQYRAALDPELAKKDPEAAANAPPYRYLFHCYYYQYHLMRFASNLLDLVRFFSSHCGYTYLTRSILAALSNGEPRRKVRPCKTLSPHQALLPPVL
jgi:hypothetical protein